MGLEVESQVIEWTGDIKRKGINECPKDISYHVYLRWTQKGDHK